jgi:hypothetical protein
MARLLQAADLGGVAGLCMRRVDAAAGISVEESHVQESSVACIGQLRCWIVCQQCGVALILLLLLRVT